MIESLCHHLGYPEDFMASLLSLKISTKSFCSRIGRDLPAVQINANALLSVHIIQRFIPHLLERYSLLGTFIDSRKRGHVTSNYENSKGYRGG